MKPIRRTRQFGFTLVEILVIVAILGILGAFVVPRMLAQTDQAKTAEPLGLLATIRKQVLTYVDASGGNAPAFDTATGMGAGTNWKALGLDALPTTRKFNYSSTGGAVATATVVAKLIATPTNTITINVDSGAMTCGGAFKPVNNAQNQTLRCV